MKTKKIGCVNAAIVCSLQDSNGKILGYTLDTPNAIAYAMAINENVARAVANYALFGETVTTRAAVADRFSWVKKETNLSRFLRWA